MTGSKGFEPTKSLEFLGRNSSPFFRFSLDLGVTSAALSFQVQGDSIDFQLTCQSRKIEMRGKKQTKILSVP